MTASFAVEPGVGYNAGMRETKTARLNATLKPSVKQMLLECAAVLRLSEADTVAEAIERLHRSREIQSRIRASRSLPPAQE